MINDGNRETILGRDLEDFDLLEKPDMSSTSASSIRSYIMMSAHETCWMTQVKTRELDARLQLNQERQLKQFESSVPALTCVLGHIGTSPLLDVAHLRRITICVAYVYPESSLVESDPALFQKQHVT